MNETSKGSFPRTTPVTSRISAVASGLLAFASMGISSAVLASDLDTVVPFNIEAEALNEALLDFGTQAHVQIWFGPTTSVGGLRTRKLKGNYTGEQALRRLLSGTHLSFVVSGKARDTVEIITTHPSSSGPQKRTGFESKSGVPLLQEVTVTGTHIRGVAAGSEPLTVITQNEIADSGYPTLEQFMQSIPQNFSAIGSGGQELNEDSLAGNLGFGTGVDLRGLGYDSTLVLVNGHRIAPAGEHGAFTDISVIPLSAIDRIEILTDGASAIYGSDAVGGVVNYILKSDESGAHTALQYGGVTAGGLRDFRGSQSIGGDWSKGGGFLSYEYHNESPLSAGDRSFSRAAPGQDLLPEMNAHSIFGTLHEEVGHALELSGDVFYSDRHNSAILGTVLAQPQDAETRQYQISVGADWRLERDWHVDARASYGRNTTKSSIPAALQEGEAPLAVANLDADGTLITLPTGVVRAAIGAEARNTRVNQTLTGTVAYIPAIHKGRTVDAAYAEVRVPLLPGSSAREAHESPVLELDAAGRYEHYTDFGSSANPELGLAWAPGRGLRFRSTWSSSFAAPQLWEIYGTSFSYLFNSPDPLSPTGRSAVLELEGANPNLGPEKSTQWTAGIDLAPARGLRASVTYYRILYKDRINAPGIPIFSALAQGDLYSAFIQRNPSPGLLAQLTSPPYLYSNATTFPFPGYGPPQTLSEAAAVANNESQNIGRTFTDGIDVSAGYSASHRGWAYHIDVDGTYVLDFQQNDLVAGPTVSILSTINNPIDLRARADGGISRGAAAISVSVNYVNRYQDNTIPSRPVPVSSWTTLNMQGRYRLFAARGADGPFSGIELALSCVNCLNRNPPHVGMFSEPLELGYDPTNASPLGRFVSFSVDKDW